MCELGKLWPPAGWTQAGWPPSRLDTSWVAPQQAGHRLGGPQQAGHRLGQPMYGTVTGCPWSPSSLTSLPRAIHIFQRTPITPNCPANVQLPLSLSLSRDAGVRKLNESHDAVHGQRKLVLSSILHFISPCSWSVVHSSSLNRP